MQIPNLATKSTRVDLYDFITVSYNNRSSKGSGKGHLLELESIILPMLKPGEKATVTIVRSNNHDYLDFS